MRRLLIYIEPASPKGFLLEDDYIIVCKILYHRNARLFTEFVKNYEFMFKPEKFPMDKIDSKYKK